MLLKEIENILVSKQRILDDWYQSKMANLNPCLYTSVDLRFSGEKLVPVDTNLFPAGFNNLNLDSIEKAATLAQDYIAKLNYPRSSKILLIGENHDRNIFYQQNLKVIESFLKKAGYEVRITNLNSTLIKENKILKIDNFIPDFIILNNDLASGMPEILQDIKQEIIPHPHNGWFRRRKSTHFAIYDDLIIELERIIGIPQYFFTAEFDVCEKVNFKSKVRLEQLAQKIEAILNKIQSNYSNSKIEQEPYVVVKSDYGTYGMGIIIIKNAEEILNLNKKLRNQMHITKGNVLNEQVIIQEGIKTIDKINGYSAEPLLYLINNEIVQFMYRVHNEKNEYANLNSIGMNIETSSKSYFYKDYSFCCNFVAKIASLAAALELSHYKD